MFPALQGTNILNKRGKNTKEIQNFNNFFFIMMGLQKGIMIVHLNVDIKEKRMIFYLSKCEYNDNN